MLNQESACCLCKSPFSNLSQPRMMPQCQHSSCTHCLKHLLATKAPNITCQHCGQSEDLNQIDLQHFPKNILLNKQLKEKNSSLFNLKKEQTADTEQSNGSSQLDNQFCDLHKKELEIICLTDKVRVCPHCALFSTHREHHLKTVKEVNQLIQHKEQQFEAFRARKALLDCKMASPQLRETIVKKFSEHKNSLVLDIKAKYTKMHQNLRLAEKNSYDEVAKKFKLINQKITELMKEQKDYEKQYRLWQRRCQELFEKASLCKKIQQKTYYFFNGPLELTKDGDKLLTEIEEKINNNLENIDKLISRIKVVDNPNIPNSLYNYLNVVIEEQEQLELLGVIGQEVISPKPSKTEESLASIEFSSDRAIKEDQPASPIKHKRYSANKEVIRSRVSQSDKSIKRRSSLELQPSNVEDLVADFCQKQQDTLDLSGQDLCDPEICEILKFVKTVKKIKGLKLVKNRLTTDGLPKVLDLIPAITNLNLSFNQLTDDSVGQLLSFRPKVPNLRIVNLSNNRINQRRVKTFIDQLKKQGLIVTI